MSVSAYKIQAVCSDSESEGKGFSTQYLWCCGAVVTVLSTGEKRKQYHKQNYRLLHPEYHQPNLKLMGTLVFLG